MTDRELERRLAQAVERAAPNDLEGVLSRCDAQKGRVIPMTQSNKKKLPRAAIAAVAACLALVLAGGVGGWVWHQASAVASIVSLDVNPSIELTVNGNSKVLSCSALNADAALVLFDMGGGADLEGTKVEVAVNAIVGALLRHGYLEDISSAILISVEDKDAARAARLESQLTDTVGAALQAQSANAAILSQTVDAQNLPAVENMTLGSNISTGKAYLILQIMDKTGTINLSSTTVFDRLAAMSVEELNEIIQAGYPGIPVGADAAILAVDSYAGTTALSSVWGEADLELDKNPPCYEVELHTAWGDFDYRVDAFTGEILSGPKDIWTTPAPDDPAPVDPAPVDPGIATPSADGDIGLEAAKAAAFQHAGLSESQVTNLKTARDMDNGRLVYEIDFWQGNVEYEYEISAADGSILKFQREDHTPAGTTPGTTTPPSATDIGLDAAKAAALAHAGLSESQVTWKKAERDTENGVLVYELDFWQGNIEYEYEVRASDGAVLKYEREDHTPINPNPAQTLAGESAAKSAALAHAGFALSDTTYCNCWVEYDHGVMSCYKVEFHAGSATYLYNIGLYDCAVLGCEHYDDHHNDHHHTSGTTGSTGSTGSGTAGAADIGSEAAKATALAHAGLTESQVTKLKVERDTDKGQLVYEVEFESGRMEYEYKIDAATGAILEYEWDD